MSGPGYSPFDRRKVGNAKGGRVPTSATRRDRARTFLLQRAAVIGKAKGETEEAAPKAPPRNAPCPCGSGKKVKRCHPEGWSPP
jgi:uncharacterized protein YchJ